MLGLPRYVVHGAGGGGNAPSLNFNFVDGSAFSPQITFTRASTATFFDSAGVLQSAAIDEPRIDYDPATLAARGLLIEEQRTNSIRNNTMQGAVAGTPGTNPTNWAVGATADGLTKEIVGTGTQNGITYVDIRWSGTSGTAATTTLFQCESQTQVAALNAQTWSGSMWVALVGGTLNNVSTLELRIRYNDGTGSILTQAGVTVATATSTMQRFFTAQTASNASTAFVNVGVIADFVNSSSVDFTLRIGLPQLEQGAFATSVIPTTTTALTRSADVASVNTLTPWYSATEGTLFAEIFLRQTGDPNSQMMASFNDTTANNRWGFSVLANTNATQALRNTGGAGLIITNTSNTATVGAVNKSALAISTGASLVLNGGTVATNASYAAPTVTRLELGQQLGSNRLNGHLRRITYYPRRLSNAQLQQITA